MTSNHVIYPGTKAAGAAHMFSASRLLVIFVTRDPTHKKVVVALKSFEKRQEKKPCFLYRRTENFRAVLLQH